MKTEHIHTVDDGRGKRAVFVNGNLIKEAFFADTRRGIVRAYRFPIRLHKWRKRLLFKTLRGGVEVRAVQPIIMETEDANKPDSSN